MDRTMFLLGMIAVICCAMLGASIASCHEQNYRTCMESRLKFLELNQPELAKERCPQ